MDARTLRVVLATSDLTEGADKALRTGASLARDAGASFRAFHCVPKPVFPYWQGSLDPNEREEWLGVARRTLREQLGRVAADALSHGDPEVVIGAPSKEIVGYAERVAADVVVLGPHRPHRALDDLLGTTADRVLRTTGRPCLVAHSPLEGPVTRILVATDFSSHARRALATVVDWFAPVVASPSDSGPRELVVDLLYVYAVGSPVYRPFDAEPLLREQVAGARERLPEDAPVTFNTRTRAAPLAVDGVAAVAESLAPDVIALGTHGHGFMARTLLGSVASSVVRTVRYPLLLFPPEAATLP
ncbi:MAG: universal stress protein [Gemmatimonadota bacterium]|nr:universal stress protein [Gemmatimonadota bacterium]